MKKLTDLIIATFFLLCLTSAVRGGELVFVGRLVPPVRSLVSIPAGLLKMRFKSFLIASTIGTAGWTALLAGAGYKLGDSYTEVDKILGPASNAVLVALFLGYVYRVWTHRNMPIEPTESSGGNPPD